ncbi:MAG: hypothetical protein WEB87_05985, partial [Bacteriovoracaceae bacterium]
MGNRSLFIFLAWIVAFAIHGKAHAKCGDVFEEINLSCLKENLSGAGEIKFIVPKQGEKIKGKTYFFVTENGVPGKFIVNSAYSSKKECSLSLNVTTYVGNDSFNPTGHFGIAKEFNTWSSVRKGFDRSSANDFQLYHKKGKCVFASNQAKGLFFNHVKPPELIQGREILKLAGSFLIFLSVFLVARAVFKDEDRFKAQSKLE